MRRGVRELALGAPESGFTSVDSLHGPEAGTAPWTDRRSRARDFSAGVRLGAALVVGAEPDRCPAAVQASFAEIVTELYLVTVCRAPTPDELANADRLVAESASPKEGYEDLMWAIINSREFIFNH